MSLTGLQLGAPGVYSATVREQPDFQPVRLDVAGFVGVAPRGPVDEPILVESWSDYQWRFGGDEGPGLLPRAVCCFFAQGGTRAYVVRVSALPRAPDPAATTARAVHRLAFAAPGPGPSPGLDLQARDEGTWGDALAVTCAFEVGQRFPTTLTGDLLDLPRGTELTLGTLLRMRRGGDHGPGDFEWVDDLTYRDVAGDRVPAARITPVAEVSRVLTDETTPVEVEVVTATVTVDASDAAIVRRETFGGLGLRNDHAAYLPFVLRDHSLLVSSPPPWPDALLPKDPFLSALGSRLGSPGADRWSRIKAGSFVGDVDVQELPVGGVEPIDEHLSLYGVDLMATHPEVALLVVPDLFWDYVEPASQQEPSTPVRPSEFVPCPPRSPDLVFPSAPPSASRLDGRTDLDEIVRRQLRLVALADRQQRFVALLDVPEHLTVDGIARWRAHIDSSYAAAYHPWLGVLPDAPGSTAVLVPPSAAAAGIIAERERRLGVPWGPANALAVDAVTSQAVVTDAEHDALFALDVNVFRAERDGFRLTSAHTVARDPDYRQLSVRRLMTLLRLVLYRQSQWLTFEPHVPELRSQLRDAIVHLLRDLYRGGAFAGDTEEDSFFVRCDEGVNPSWSQDLGRVVAEVGVAPASPLEYLVVRISQEADGSVRVEG